MQVERIFNNNVVQSLDGRGEEVVVMGKGIGFGKRVGDLIDQSLIEKTFVLHEDHDQFVHVYSELSSQESELVLNIIKLAEEELHAEFPSNLYLTLADHLHFTVKRYYKSQHLINPLTYDVRKFYPKEYRVGKKALDLINITLQIDLSDAEATAIALHLINAQQTGSRMNETVKMVQMVEEILMIIRKESKVELEIDSISYHRLVTHLQYFTQRIFEGIQLRDYNDELYQQVRKSYPESLQIAHKIKDFVEGNFNYLVGGDELVYLTIHIQRFIR